MPEYGSANALDQKNILVTRPADQATDFAAKFVAAGANVILLPVVNIQPLEDFTQIDEAIKNLSQYDWLIFSSSNSVRFFLQRLKLLNESLDGLSGLKIAAIGPSTARKLEQNDLKVDFIPVTNNSEALAKELPIQSNQKILFPTSDIARDELPEILRQRGVAVEVLPIYSTTKNEADPEFIKDIFARNPEIITFTSPSCVLSLIEMLTPLQISIQNYIIACIGPVTAECAREQGLIVDIVGQPHTTDGLIEKIKKYFADDKQTKKTADFRRTEKPGA